MKDGYYILLQKIEKFIKRYYFFKIVKGFLLFLSLVFVIVSLESIIEYYNYTSINFRTTLFYLSLIIFLFIISYYVIIPVLALFRIGKRISFKQASKIISNHFEHIDDNLINTIELGNNIKGNHNETDLLIASIEQRTKLLNPTQFKFSIPFKNLTKPFFYFLGSGFIILFILSFAPGVFRDGTYRIIDYGNYYEPNAPFKFILKNKSFFVQKGENFTLELIIDGDYIPNEVYISIGENSFLMIKNEKGNNLFNFTIKNLNNSIDIFFLADKYKSQKTRIEVLPAPILKDFIVELVPPPYTGVENSQFKNSGDLNIPFGSVVKWKFKTNFTDSVLLFFIDDSVNCSKNEKQFEYSRQLFKTGIYSVSIKNNHFTLNDNITYNINVIPDIYPDIDVHSIQDSNRISSFYYMLNVNDDYGFQKLTFNYRIIGNNNSKNFIKDVIELNKGNKNQDVFFYYDFSNINLVSENDYIEYFFEIFDNDYFSGYKSTKSTLNIYKPQSQKETKEEIDKLEKNTEKSIDESKKIVDDIQKDIEEFKRKELNNELSDWDRKSFLKNISKKQKELDKLLSNIKNENQKKNNLKNQLYSENEEILKKQKEIQEILDQIMDEELKQLLRELDELRSKLDQKDFEKLKEKLDLSYKNLNESLDKSLELLKRFQVEEKMQNLSEDFKKLSKRQENLSTEEYKKKDLENQKINQNSIKSNFNSLKEDFEETINKNKELKSPYKLEQLDDELSEIEKKLDDINNDIDKKSDKKINEQRKDASQSMEEMSKKLNNMLQQMNSQSMNMNLQDLRQITENLNLFSFNQEDIYNDLRITYSNDPKFVQLIKQQNNLNLDFEMIKDSLNSLASRIPQMNRMISKEVKDMEFSLGKTLFEFEARHRRASIRYQRNVINSSNILALYLEELNEQIQNQMSQGSSGKGKKQPGNAMKKLKQQQENLKQQLEQLLEQLKSCDGKNTGNQINEGVVKSLAEQEILNKMLNDLQQSDGLSPETIRKLKEIKNLSDKNIDDLINKNITTNLLKRNENIKTRLLEAEKSEREREKEKIRKSKEGRKAERELPAEIDSFLKKNNTYKETLQKNNLNFKNYYKNLSKKYYQGIK
ncbi:MAG: hypothetical protein DRJ10_00120 [Bacteroidetes bacterium]|nr:MAG: hypothetical protein DRJ10_00085 [Bacteroidota bacterium]RLD84836.1 MAG: hypothetical protein DRJ10_00120 [Bacteroidota bacterium]